MTALVDLMGAALRGLGDGEIEVVVGNWLDGLSKTELAALFFDWEGTWAREEQVLFPKRSRHRSSGFLTARRFGKTTACSNFVIDEARAGRAMRIGFLAQNWDKTLEVMVHGEDGLIAKSPPWFKAIFEKGRVLWPNGAQAFPFTPEVPGAIRGPGVHLLWCSEIQSWPVHTREEAWFNGQIMCSLGYARTIWDATPKRRHPILKQLLEQARRRPDVHRVVRGVIEANVANLAEGLIEDLHDQLDGTQRGAEELGGEFSEDAEGALVKQEWITTNRGPAPARFTRKVLACDPAITNRETSDPTGIAMVGGDGARAYVLGDYTDRHEWDAWGDLLVDLYLKHECDCIIVETNRGGTACANNITRAARDRKKSPSDPGIATMVFDEKHRQTTRHNPRLIYVLEVHGRKAKEVRLEPVAGAYKKGRVVHVLGVNLSELEDELTTWEPDGKHESPNRLDVDVYGVGEVLQLQDDSTDPRRGVDGIEKLNAQLSPPPSPILPLGGRGGRRI